MKTRIYLKGLSLAISFLFSISLIAQPPFTVNDPGDTSDALVGDGNCADASGNCTLRAAIEEANGTSGIANVLIDFSTAMTINPSAVLPTISRTNVTIDATTVTGASCGTLVSGTAHSLQVVLDGSGLSTGVDGFVVNATDVTIKGLVIQNFPDRGIDVQKDNVSIECCYIGTDQTGTSAAANGGRGIAATVLGVENLSIQNCLISGNGSQGIRLGLLAEATIQGCLIGTDVNGTSAIPNTIGISGFGARNTVIGGTTASERNIISGNSSDGFNGGGTGSQNISFFGNYVGVDITGLSTLGNGGSGIVMSNGNDNFTIGGTSSGEGNLVSGNGIFGVVINDESTVEGNLIGTDKNGANDLGNGDSGLLLRGICSNSIIASNTIAYNGADGIETGINVGTGNKISQNSIFSNDGIGIDLNENGLSSNDTDDVDSGPNNMQNAPEINNAHINTSSNEIVIKFSVPSSTLNSSYDLVVEFFQADADAQEGKNFIGQSTYTSAEAGTEKTVTFSNASLGLTIADYIIATAIDADNNTSEFTETAAFLPVDFINFEVWGKKNGAVLIWETASEINNEGFEVEHLENQKWKTINFINGQGTSNKPTQYELELNNLSGGSHLFRLKQLDFDGSYTYSDIVEIEIDAAISDISVYPNPIMDHVNIHFKSDLLEDSEIEIYTTSGQLIKKVFCEAGMSTFKINTSEWLSGSYLLRIKEGENLRVLRLLKM